MAVALTSGIRRYRLPQRHLLDISFRYIDGKTIFTENLLARYLSNG